MIGESVTGISSRIILITLFSNRSTALLPHLPASAHCANMQEQNYFPEPNRHGWGTTNSKPPGSIIMIGQSDTGRSSPIILITPFSGQSDRGSSSPIRLITPFSGQSDTGSSSRIILITPFSSRCTA
jgi:hypothetical protein